MCVEVEPLPAPEVGEEGEAAPVEPLEQHDPCRGSALTPHGGQGHRRRLGYSGALGVAEPVLEAGDRVGGKVTHFQAGLSILGAEGGEVGGQCTGPASMAVFNGNRGICASNVVPSGRTK